MQVIAREYNNQGDVEPVVVEIPVLHKLRTIGTAEVDSRGNIKITIHDDFDKQGIFRMFANNEAGGIQFGIDSGPLHEIRKSLTRDD